MNLIDITLPLFTLGAAYLLLFSSMR